MINHWTINFIDIKSDINQKILSIKQNRIFLTSRGKILQSDVKQDSEKTGAKKGF